MISTRRSGRGWNEPTRGLIVDLGDVLRAQRVVGGADVGWMVIESVPGLSVGWWRMGTYVIGVRRPGTGFL